MSKKTFRRLAIFIVFSFIFSVCVVGIELKNYFDNHSKQENINEAKTPDQSDDQEVNPITQPQEESDGGQGDQGEAEEDSPEIPDIQTEPEEDMGKEITLSFTGDILLGDVVLGQYDKSGNIDGILSESLKNRMIQSDITMVNQEFPFSLRGEKAEDKQFTFRTDPMRVGIFHEMGIDIVSLANNHTLDYGIDALIDTLTTLEGAGIKQVGAGRNLSDARETSYTQVKDKNIAILSASRVIPVVEWNATNSRPGLFTTYDPTALLEEIGKAKDQSDFIIVFVHWGIERKHTPETYQRTMAKQYIEAGADIVVGSHPHVLQGIEFHQGKPIIYSLGNFIFGTTTGKTALLQAIIDSEQQVTVQIIPCKADNAYTYEITNENERLEYFAFLNEISFNATIDEKGYVFEAQNP